MRLLSRIVLFVSLGLLLGSCAYSGSGYSGGPSARMGYYGGVGWHDPFYSRRCCYSHGRPPAYRPPNRPSHRPGRPANLPEVQPSRRR